MSWGNIPFNLGSWISGFGRQDAKDYATMTQPDRRVYFAGDHTSHIVGWQEGAALSAIRAVNMIGQKVQPGGIACVVFRTAVVRCRVRRLRHRRSCAGPYPYPAAQ